MKKFLFLFILLLPAAYADHDECSLLNLEECATEFFLDILLDIINFPLDPLIDIFNSLLTAEVTIDLFFGIWSIVRYILGFFYIFIILYAGLLLLVGSASPFQRARAKDMLRDALLMMVLINASFILYGHAISLVSSVNTSIVELVDTEFLRLSIDSVFNILLEILFFVLYAFLLVVACLLLTLRYILVSIGVIFVPIGIFCFYLPPLKSYGKFILSALGVLLVISFIDLLIILACSMIAEVGLLEHGKILISMSTVTLVSFSIHRSIKFAMNASTQPSFRDDLQDAIKYIKVML